MAQPFSMMKGFTINFFMYFSTFFGFSLFLMPSFVTLFFSPSLFRSIGDFFCFFWCSYPAALFELTGTKVKFYGDNFPKNETVIMVLNHRTTFDWLFLWSYVARFGTLLREKIILKSPLKKIPGPGWAMQMFCFLFLDRRWENDKPHMTKLLNHFVLLNYPIQLLLFPEGTDLDKKGKLSSDKFAMKNSLPIYDYVLHPKTTGFIHCVNLLRGKVEAVYDLTIAYPHTLPARKVSLMVGEIPEEIHFEVKRYSIEEIPVDEVELDKWLKQIWADKEEKLRKYYEKAPKERRFETNEKKSKSVLPVFISSFIFWTVVTLLSFYLFYQYFYFKIYIVGSHIFSALVTFYFGGYDNIQVKLNASSHTTKSKTS